MKGRDIDASALQAIAHKRKNLKQPQLSRSDIIQLQDQGKILIVVQEMVFDVTNYISHHPGGEHILKSNSGKDSTDKFLRIHTHNAHSLLAGMYAGDYVEPEEGNTNVSNVGKLVNALQTPESVQASVTSHLTFGSALQKDKERNIEKSMMVNTIDLADIRATMTVGEDESSDMVSRPHLDLSFPQRGFLQEIPEEDETVSVTPMLNTSKLDAFSPTQTEAAEELPDGAEGEHDDKLNGTSCDSDTCLEGSNGNVKPQDLFTTTKTAAQGKCPFSAPGTHPSAEGNTANCPFMALTMMKSDTETPPVPKLVGQGSSDSLNSNRKKSGSFTSSVGRNMNSSSYLNFAGIQPADAVESPRSMRSRDDVTVSSRNASTSFQGRSSHFGSKSTLQGTNLRQAGGVYRASRVRRKHVHVKKNKAPKVDLNEWKFNANFIVSSWRKLLRKVSYADLGLSIYESVRDVEELEPLFRFTNRVVQGTKFVDMLSSIVDNIHSPADIYVKIADLAPLHHRKGVKGSQMPLMQAIVMRVFQHTLGDEMLEEETKAWLWMWDFLKRALDQSLKEVGSTLSVVRDCWESILEQYTPAELGEHIYDHLFKLAPNVATLFTKPREVMAIKMGNTLGTLVSFADDPESMKQQVTWLGVRHVLYNVRPHHIPLIGPVFMNVLSEAAGEAWTQDVEKSWGIVIKMVCENMAEAIQNGEDYGTSLEHIVSYLREHVDMDTFSKNFQAELAISCPSIFENMQQEMRSDSASSFSRTLSKAVNSIGADQGNGISPSSSAVSQNGVSHLIRMSAFNRAEHKNDDDLFSHSSSAGNNNLSQAHSMRQKRMNSRFSTHSKEPESEEVELLIQDVYKFVAEACELVWEPEKQVERVYIYAPRFYKRGIRSENLKGLGYAFEVALKNTVGEENWGEHMSDSIRWLWQTLVECLTNELNGLKTSRGELILDHWQEVRVNTDIEDLGSVFWKHLNDESPEQTHLFRRSFTMWGKLLQHIMEMLLLSLAEPEIFFEQLFELTIRHIRYGVRPEYLSPFGTALFLTLEEFLKDKWDDHAEAVWKDVWKRAANSMSRGLSLGGNGITHALVEGDTEALQIAMQCAPRNLRAEWLCQVDINGASISPLYWALHDGKFSIVEFILSDLLTIRADIHGYYYGREELFKHHEDIVGKLGRECIGLLPVLFDGLLWHSKEKLQGRKIRVNYYIRDLYGDPDLEKDPWNSPLAWLVNLDDNESFKHPAVRKTLQLKWEGFGLKIFCLKEISYFLMLLTFMLGHVRDPSSCDKNYLGTRIVLLIIAICTLAVQILMIASQLKRKLMLPVTIGKFTIHLPRGLVGLWNILRIVTCVIIIVAFANQSCDTIDCSVDPNATECLGMNLTRRELSLHLLAAKAKADSSTTKSSLSSFNYAGQTALAIAAVLLWVQMFQLSILSTPMAAFTYTIGIMFGDLSHSLFMILILMAAFGSALTIIGDAPFDQGWDRTIVLLLQEVLGVAQPLYSDISSFTRFLLLFFVICVTIGMLNILIAQLTITYDKLSADKEGFAMKHRASICIEIESFLPMSWRRSIFCDLGFHIPLPFSESDEGPAGGIQAIERDDCPRYVPDRILRFTGDASPSDPWPVIGGPAAEVKNVQ